MYSYFNFEEGVDTPSKDEFLALKGYSIHKKCGEGAFGIVFSAFVKQSEKPVAVKAQRLELDNDDSIMSLGHEIKCMQRVLQCQYTVSLYSCFVENGYIFMVMNLCSGGTILDHMEKGEFTEDQLR